MELLTSFSSTFETVNFIHQKQHYTANMVYPETAEGFMISDQKNCKSFEKKEFKLKQFEDRDIDIAIECCGVCGA